MNLTQDQLIALAEENGANITSNGVLFSKDELAKFAELLTNSDAEPVELLKIACDCADGVNEQGLVFEDTGLLKLYRKWNARASHSKAEQDAELISLLKDADLVCPSSAGFDGRDTFFACGECSTCKLIALTKG